MDIWPLPRITFRSLSTIEESRPVALIAPAGDSVSKGINLRVVVQAEPPHNERDYAEMLAKNLPSQVGVVYAVGEDPMLLNVAKIVANRGQKPLVIVPTALSSDAAFSSAIILNEGGTPTHVDSDSAEEVVIDFDVIKAAPPDLRAVGIVDVLAIITALNDWTYANAKKKTTPDTKFEEWAVKISSAIALQALKAAPMIGKGDPAALRELIDLICLSTQLSNQLGHRRISYGAEHLFADAFQPPARYAEKVAVGILLSAALHNRDRAAIRSAMQSAGVRLDALAISDIRADFNTLPDYVKKVNAPYTILNDLQSGSKELADALEKSTLVEATASKT